MATTRPVAPAKLPAIHAGVAEVINLASLRRVSVAALAEAILGAPANEDLIDLVFARTAGNPFHAAQLLYYLRDDELLEPTENGWAPHNAARESARLPDTLRHVFTARLDRLAPEVRELVQAAAIFGRVFNAHMLEHVASIDGGLADRLGAAEAAAVVTPIDDERYIFQHALLRDTAYGMLSRSRRGELHQRAAAAYEITHAEDLGPAYSELGRHYEAAFKCGIVATRERAYECLMNAGARADAGNEVEAAEFYSRALDLTEDDGFERQKDTLLARAKTFAIRGVRQRESEDLTRLEELAAKSDDTALAAEVAIRWGDHAHSVGDLAAAVKYAESGLALAEAIGDTGRQGRARHRLGETLWRQGEAAAAKEQFNAIVSMNLPHEELRVQGQAQRWLGNLMFYSYDFEGARAAWNVAMGISRDCGDLWNAAACVNNLANVESFTGRFGRARDMLDDAMRRQLGNKWRESEARMWRATNACRAGAIEELLDDAREILAIAEASDDQMHISDAETRFAWADYYRGNLDEALARALKATEIARSVNSWRSERAAFVIQLEVLLGRRQFDEAQKLISHWLDVCADHPDWQSEAYALAGLVTLPTLAGTQEQQKHLASLVTILATKRVPHWIGQVGSLYLRAYQSLASMRSAWADQLLLAGYQRIREDELNVDDDNYRRTFIENVPAHRELYAEVARVYGDDVPQEPANLTEVAEALGAGDFRLEPEVETDSQPEPASYAPSAAPAINLPAPEPVPARREAPATPEPVPDAAAADNQRLDLSGAVLTRARLDGLDLSGAALRAVRLDQASLRGVVLVGADLRAAVLTGADLQGADLRGADLRGATLDGANLTDVIHDETTRWPAVLSTV